MGSNEGGKGIIPPLVESVWDFGYWTGTIRNFRSEIHQLSCLLRLVGMSVALSLGRARGMITEGRKTNDSRPRKVCCSLEKTLFKLARRTVLARTFFG